jgi:hypothetical protein
MNKTLRYGAGLIALYLVVYYYTGAGTVISRGTAGASTVIKAFQGR